jgi:hypothetical protein
MVPNRADSDWRSWRAFDEAFWAGAEESLQGVLQGVKAWNFNDLCQCTFHKHDDLALKGRWLAAVMLMIPNRLHCKLEFMDGAFSGLALRTFLLSESQGTEHRNSKNLSTYSLHSK